MIKIINETAREFFGDDRFETRAAAEQAIKDEVEHGLGGRAFIIVAGEWVEVSKAVSDHTVGLFYSVRRAFEGHYYIKTVKAAFGVKPEQVTTSY